MLQCVTLAWTCAITILVALASARRIEIPLRHFLFTRALYSTSSVRDISRSSLYMCIRECRSRPQCLAMTFFRNSRICRLGTGSILTWTSASNVYTVYNNWSEIKSEDFLGPCVNRRCPPRHQCIALSNSKTTCVVRECQDLERASKPVNGYSPPYRRKRKMAALEAEATAYNRSCPTGHPGPNIQVDIRCNSGGWSQVKDITCYDCDAPLYYGATLRNCFKQMTVNQTYDAAKTLCERSYKLPIVNHEDIRNEIISIANGCTWIDAKYDDGSGKCNLLKCCQDINLKFCRKRYSCHYKHMHFWSLFSKKICLIKMYYCQGINLSHMPDNSI